MAHGGIFTLECDRGCIGVNIGANCHSGMFGSLGLADFRGHRRFGYFSFLKLKVADSDFILEACHYAFCGHRPFQIGAIDKIAIVVFFGFFLGKEFDGEPAADIIHYGFDHRYFIVAGHAGWLETGMCEFGNQNFKRNAVLQI